MVQRLLIIDKSKLSNVYIFTVESFMEMNNTYAFLVFATIET